MAEVQLAILIKEASQQMLGKESPDGRQDWMKVMNFVAWNLDFPACLHICHEIVRLHNVPLKEEEIKDIVDFQAYHRETKHLSRRERIAELLGDAAIHDADVYMGG